MNKILKISTVLSWINIIFWGLGCLILLLFVVKSGALGLAVILVFPSAVVLHNYAALQLRKSIRNLAVPLGNQTPTGIRFIGFVAMFIGIINLIDGYGVIQNPQEVLKQTLTQFPQLKDMNMSIGKIRLAGFISLLTGLCVAVNVNLNFRLLRWYYFLRANDSKEK